MTTIRRHVHRQAHNAIVYFYRIMLMNLLLLSCIFQIMNGVEVDISSTTNAAHIPIMPGEHSHFLMKFQNYRISILEKCGGIRMPIAKAYCY